MMFEVNATGYVNFMSEFEFSFCDILTILEYSEALDSFVGIILYSMTRRAQHVTHKTL